MCMLRAVIRWPTRSRSQHSKSPRSMSGWRTCGRQRLRRPPFDIDVEHQLFLFVGELIGDAVAVEVDLEAARRLADRERAFTKFRRVVEQRPVVELHEDVGVREL